MACAVISSEKKLKVLRPRFFEANIAASAFLISVSASAPCSGKMLIPILHVTLSELPFRLNGGLSSRATRSATSAASSCEPIGPRAIRNSSPTNRATVSSSRAHACSLAAMPCSSSSPRECPRQSLMILKLSMSRWSTPTLSRRRFAAAMVLDNRSWTRVRLGRLVRESK